MKRPDYDVRLLRVAEDDLNEIVSYISADRPSGAETFSETQPLRRGLDQLAHAMHDEGNLRAVPAAA